MTTTPKIPEDSLQGALREVKEEVGGDLLPEKGHVILSDIHLQIFLTCPH